MAKNIINSTKNQEPEVQDEKLIQEKKELDIEGFKKILEYFVKHMVYRCNENNQSDKKDVSVDLDNINESFKNFKPEDGSKSGQGYRGNAIQKKMEDFALVSAKNSLKINGKNQRICVSIDSTNGFRGGSYLHLVSTNVMEQEGQKKNEQNKITNETAGTNINPIFETIKKEEKIPTVQFVGLEVGPSQNKATYVFPALKYSFTELGLCEDTPDPQKIFNLHNFFDYFKQMRQLELQSMGGLTKKGYDQLLATHNMILTGAPGTGKTWSAKNIAAWLISGNSFSDLNDNEKSQFEEQYELVQFHPSYDYTDFVEGLRPISKDKNNNNEIGFKLVPGVFRKFCEKALKEWEFCNKVKELIKDKKIRDDEIDKYVNAIERDSEGFKLDNEKLKECSEEECSEEECLKNAQKFFDIAIKKFAKKFVFIIDEINRGELSKIFGELFYSIDPGYRGPSGAVLTQYANMVAKPNVFDEKLGFVKSSNQNDTNNFGHFFVPENVYIIGTMNDIDRSVESMDFAMRRRFSFIEVKAEECMDMWTEDWKDLAASCMKAVNVEIEKLPGLSSAYHIGPAYFKKLNDNGCDFFKLWDNHLYGVIFEYLRGKKDAETTINKIQDAYLKALVKAITSRFNYGGKWGEMLLDKWKLASSLDSSININVDSNYQPSGEINVKRYLDNLKKFDFNISENDRANDIFKLSMEINHLMEIGKRIEGLKEEF